MTKRCKHIGEILLGALLLHLGAAPGAADICVPPEVGLNWLGGRIVTTSDSGQEPLDGAKIEVFSPGHLDNAIATTLTDTEGRFNFAACEDGRYVVRVSCEHYISFAVQVRLDRLGTTPRRLLVNLGVNALDACGGGWAKVELREP